MYHGLGELPSEILDVIFYFLHSNKDLDTLCQCILVCKKWKLPAQRSLYSEIELVSAQAVNLLISANDLKLDSYPGKFTHAIEYDGYLEISESRTSWIDSFKDMFPHLRQIDSKKNDAWYYNALIKAYEQGKWTRMENIGDCSVESSGLHNACALLHRKTLKFLSLYEGHDTKSLTSLYDKLGLFSNVHHLCFGTNKYSFLDTVEHVAQNMQGLKHLSFENLEGTVFNPEAQIEYIDLSLVSSQHNIKRLTVQGISYGNDNFLLFLMKKFPKLEYLKINPKKGLVISHGPLMEKIKAEKSNFTVPVLARFMSFVSKCSVHSMDFFYTTLNTEDILSTYWSLCAPEETKQLVVAYFEGLEWLSGGTEFEDSDSLVNIRLHIDPFTRQKAVALNYKFSKVILPHLGLLEKNGAIIEQLVMRIGPKKILSITEDLDDEDMLDMIEGYFFSHILQYCVKLKTLHITLAEIIMLNPDQSFNRSITYLDLNYVGVSDTILFQISTIIPNLRRLILKDIHLVKNSDKYVDPYFNSVLDMPLTTFRFLHIENYTVDGLSINEYPTEILIKLTTVDGERFFKYAPGEEISYIGLNIEWTNKEKKKFNNTSHNRAVNIGEDEYYNGLGSKTCANLHVLCNSVNYLEVSLKKIKYTLNYQTFYLSMMKNFEDLPETILHKIFAHVYVDRKYYDILQCELVCKSWMAPAQQSLYSTITLKDEQAVERLRIAMNNVSDSCPGQYTRSLAYHGRSEVDGGNGTSWINLFIDAFPNLRYVFSDIQGFRYYLALIKAHRLGKLKDIESIGPCSRESANLHNSCALLYKDTLTALNVRDSKKINMDTSLYERLDMFPKVKRLYVDTNLHNFFETAEDTAKAIPRLHGLFFENTETTCSVTVAPYKPVDISLIIPQLSLKYLIIQSISYENDNFLLYLMAKFLSIQRIYINRNKDNIAYTPMLDRIKSAQNNFSVAVVSKFMAFLAKCESYSVDLFFTTLNVDEVLNGYWNLCSPGEPKNVSVTYEQGADWPETDVHPADCNSLSHMSMNMNLLKEKNLIFTYEPCNAIFPHLRVLENTGKGLDQFSFCVGSEKNEDVLSGQDQNSIEMVNGKFFSHIIENCTSLKSLKVQKARIISLSFTRSLFEHSLLTEMTLEQVVISEDILKQLSAKLPSLKKLYLRNIHCNHEDINILAPKFNSTIDMPSTSFKYLSVQNYLLDGVCDSDYPAKLFIRVTVKDFNKYYKCTPCGESSFTYNSSDDESDEEYAQKPETEYFDQATPVDEEEYTSGFNDEGCSTVHVRCKSLNYLVISLSKIDPDFGCSIVIQNNDTSVDMSLMSKEEIHEYFVN
ncbi:uncharacterized protein EV154DRAFT_571313 [Mucor mucedo]|uniref:uncharacterized protein n=1 Tax=Mucor mucedo TaxID=29922 RepID=UPI00221E9F07|nr:uncharacterized protein EV154DRAFT_571313 [Mucor mucedo]KAI7868683.1 hypothetical protein EV154DRAFT_571313 [Mucor mucedo]